MTYGYFSTPSSITLTCAGSISITLMSAQNVADLPNFTLATNKCKKTQENAIVKIIRENQEYNKYKETKNVKVPNGFITFTQHFKYIGS